MRLLFSCSLPRLSFAALSPLVIAVAAASLPPAALAADTDTDTAQACAVVAGKRIPGVDLTALARSDGGDGTGDDDCTSRYYTPGHAPDYAAALQCARSKNDALVLMMLYANGRGVPRDVDAALKIACVTQVGAPAENEGRIAHLAALRNTRERRPFDMCDDITSGYMEGRCASIAERYDAHKRRGQLDALTQHWNAADRTALAALTRRKAAYLSAHDSEVDLSGTARAAEVIGEEATQEAGFLKLLALLEHARLPRTHRRPIWQRPTSD